MATENKRGYSNPYGSANLGSGVRTTTGGTYRNPRLGIEDNTAFARGFASTFRMPEEKEEEEVSELELPTFDYIGSQKDAMLGDTEWKENSYLANQLVSDLQPLKSQFEKCTKASDQQCLKRIGRTLNLLKQGHTNWLTMLTKYADSEVYDHETSKGQYMIGTDKKNLKRPDGSYLSLADVTEINNNAPENISQGIVDGKSVLSVKLDGTVYNINTTDLTENYLTNSFDVRSDIGLDVQTAMSSDGFTSDWKDEPVMFNSETKETIEDGTSVTKLKGYEGIVQGLGYFNKAEDKSRVFSRNIYKTISSPNVNSAFHKLTAKMWNGFISSEQENFLTANPSLIEAKDLNSFREQMRRVPNDVKLRMLQDEAEQEWLIANSSNGYRRGDDGRAERLDKNYLIKQSKTTKPIDEDVSGSGGSWSSGSSISDIRQNLFTQDLTKSPIGKHQGKMVLLDDNTMGSLQREITSRFGQGNFIFKKDRLEDMLIKSELSENEDFEDYESIDDLSNKERTALDLRIKKQIANYSSQYPEGQIFTYINGKVDVDTILQDGMMYNKDIKDFIKSFGSVSERKDIEKGWAGSDLQKEDMKVRNAVRTGDMTGLTDWEKKQAEFIIARKKIK